jgi:signal transduction histidine kinase
MGRVESTAIGAALALSALVVLGDQWNEARRAHMRSVVERRAEALGQLEGRAASAGVVVDAGASARVRDVREDPIALTDDALDPQETPAFGARASTFGVALETVRLAASGLTPRVEPREEPLGASLQSSIAAQRQRLAADERAARALARSGRVLHAAGLGMGMALLLFACGKLRRDLERGARGQKRLRERGTAGALDDIADAEIMIDQDARVQPVDRATASRSPGDAVDQPLATPFSFGGHGASQASARALAGEPSAAQTTPPAADGGERPLALHATPLRDHDHSVQGDAITCRDRAVPATLRDRDDGVQGDAITCHEGALHAEAAREAARIHEQLARALRERDDAQRALERSDERLRQTQKFETLGNVAGSVAHDFNNLLSVILSYGELLQRSLPTDSPRYTEAEQITRASKRAAELTRQLLAFSRQELPAVAAVDLGASLDSMRHMLEHLLGEDIALHIQAAREPTHVRIDAGQLEQVLLNLSLNARDAMPLGGTLSIQARDVMIDDQAHAEHPAVEPGPYVHLSVEDTGTGMDASVQARIFEPFFTTKQRGKGTGLGLPTVVGIVKQNGGVVRVESALGRGTTFHLYFPRVHAADADDTGPRALALGNTISGDETVLLVEDDEQVRALAQAVLERSGYRVLAANGGEEALRVERDWSAPIHVLVTDVVMPRMSGRQLAERLCRFRPCMRVLFMSGYADDKVMPHGVLQAGIHLLHKPLTPDALARKVREVLDRV